MKTLNHKKHASINVKVVVLK